MLKIFKEEPKIKFINKRYIAFALSGLIILAGLVTFLTRGFNWGIDFSGGTMIEVGFQQPTTVNQLRASLAKIDLGDAQITRIGGGENKFFIKTLASLKKLNLSAARSWRTSRNTRSWPARSACGMMSESERAQAAAGKIDLNNSAEGEIARFLREKGIGDEDCPGERRADHRPAQERQRHHRRFFRPGKGRASSTASAPCCAPSRSSANSPS